jgi:hypothetical protein
MIILLWKDMGRIEIISEFVHAHVCVCVCVCVCAAG